MTRLKKSLLMLCSALMFSGCGTSFMSTRQTNPAIEERLGGWSWPWLEFSSDAETLGIDASRRIMIMRLENGNPVLSSANGTLVDKEWQKGEFCSEPPPDAMVNTASQLYSSLAAKIDAMQGADGEGKAQLMQQIASVMNPLFIRSQSLQWTRDTLSFACNAHLNRAINREEYFKLIQDIINKSNKLIAAEISKMPTAEIKYDIKDTGGAPKLISPITGNAGD